MPTYSTRLVALLITSLLLFQTAALAQPRYTLVGSASGGGSGNCVRLTRAADGQTGAVWLNQRLRLTQSFELTATLNFGSNPNGADGMAMVFQTQGTNTLGGAGNGLGYRGLTPSFAIEFDTNPNGDNNDPAFDHVALVRNGQTNHALNVGLPAPVPIVSAGSSVKDGRDHLVTVRWNAASLTLRVEIDCQVRITHTIDLSNSIFSGATDIFWGFTAATGSANNEHTVCFPKPSLDTLVACRSDQVTLTSPLSANGQYQWSPTAGLAEPQAQSTQLLASVDQLYRVQYADQCGVAKFDSVLVQVNGPVLASTSERTYDCPGQQPLLLDPQAAGAGLQYQWFPNGSNGPTLSTNVPGSYSVTITSPEGCTASQGFVIQDNCLPNGIFVPDAFTPNGDGTNDLFAWSSTVSLDAQLSIYNRWGELIFVSTDAAGAWNGTYRGGACPVDVYTWVLNVGPVAGANRERFIKRGRVMLLR